MGQQQRWRRRRRTNCVLSSSSLLALPSPSMMCLLSLPPSLVELYNPTAATGAWGTISMPCSSGATGHLLVLSPWRLLLLRLMSLGGKPLSSRKDNGGFFLSTAFALGHVAAGRSNYWPCYQSTPSSHSIASVTFTFVSGFAWHETKIVC